MITADHGCDPSYTATTDHTREYVPLLVLGKGIKPGQSRHEAQPSRTLPPPSPTCWAFHMGRRGHEFRGRNTVSTILRKT